MIQLTPCVITPSFKPDFERCRLLSESIDEFSSSPIQHYIIVDQRDYRLFQQLERSNRTVLTVESVLPWWIYKIPLFKNGWFSLKTLPIRNWLIQQIVKLEIANWIQEDIFIFVDSDVTFVRPFEHSQLIENERVRLFREAIPASQWKSETEIKSKWFDTAHTLLNLPPFVGISNQETIINYVGNYITWKRDNVIQLQQYLEQQSQKSWIEAIASVWHFSEYTLYGVFVEQILGENSGHYLDPQKVSLDYWGTDVLSPQELQNMFQNVPPEYFAVMISSKANIPVADFVSFTK